MKNKIETKEDVLDQLKPDNFSSLLERMSDTSDLFHAGYEEGYESGFKVALKQARQIVDKHFEDRNIGSMSYEIRLDTEDFEDDIERAKAQLKELARMISSLSVSVSIKDN